MKRAIAGIVTASLVLGTASCTQKSEKITTDATGEFVCEILDVGKADAIILRSQNHTVLIDSGEKGDGKKVLEYLSENGISSVDYFFITHFDRDHVGGAAKIINNIEIKNIITPDYAGTNDEYTSFIEAMQDKGIEPVLLKENMSFMIDDCLFNVYPPEKASYEESDNDYSLAISVIHGENSFLFAGDAEEERLSEFFKQFDLVHDFLKVSHHGRYNDNTKKFLKSVNPEYAVITCSEKNPPEDKVLEILNHLKTNVYLSENGNIEVISDGKNIQINQ